MGGCASIFEIVPLYEFLKFSQLLILASLFAFLTASTPSRGPSTMLVVVVVVVVLLQTYPKLVVIQYF